MKITKRQLRRIIKEEKQKLLREAYGQKVWHSAQNQGVMDQLHTAIDALIGELGNEGAHMELQGIVDDWDFEVRPAPSGARGDIMTREDR
jgi:hypothetical protein